MAETRNHLTNYQPVAPWKRWLKDHVLSLATDWKARAHYAGNDPEVTKRRPILVERSIAGNIGLLISGVTPIENMLKKGSFDSGDIHSALYKTIMNPIFATAVADWLNIYTSEWNSYHHKQEATTAIQILQQWQKEAQSLDAGAFAGELDGIRHHTLMKLFEQQPRIETLQHYIAEGTGLTPEAARELEQHMTMRSDLLHEIARFKEQKKTSHAAAATPLTPEKIITETQDILVRGIVTTLREAQLIFALAGSLLVESLPTIGRLEFIPADSRALLSNDIPVLAEAITQGDQLAMETDLPAAERLLAMATRVTNVLNNHVELGAVKRLEFMKQNLGLMDQQMKAGRETHP